MVCPNTPIRQRLEAQYRAAAAVPPDRPLPMGHQFVRFVQQVGAAIAQALTRDRRAPRISSYYDSEGQVIWHVYDPVNQQRLVTPSDAEVLDWLEQRHCY